MALIFVLLLGAAVWFWMRTLARRPGQRPSLDHDVDPDVLADAEDEVRDLDISTSPDEADDQLPDWGPGTYKG